MPPVATILAGFPAGFVALLAPCCFAVLLAAYFARFTHERDRMARMTLVFATGVWAVYLVPTLGIAALSSVFLAYHMWIYKIGGAFMLALAVMLLLGYRVMLPKPEWLRRQSLESQRPRESYDYGAVFGLGFVSGLSTVCCAPVLASLLALSSASGSIIVALAAGLYFVLGMTLPLFAVAVVADRDRLRRFLRDLQKRPAVSYRLGARRVALTTGDLLAAALYAVFGFAMAFLFGGMGTATSGEMAMNMRTLEIDAWLQAHASFLPLWLVVAFPIAVVAIICTIATWREAHEIRESNEGPGPRDGGGRLGDCCH